MRLYGARLDPSATSPRRWMFAALGLTCLAVAGLSGWNMWESRAVAVATDVVENDNLAGSLAQHAHDLMQAIDVMLVDIRERAEVDGLSPARLERLHARMLQDIASVPMVHGLFVYDAEGEWVVNSLPVAARNFNNSDRDYFIWHRSHPGGGVFIGVPVQSRSDGGAIVTVSRRIEGPDGRFEGVVLATVSTDALRQFYAGFDMGPKGAITLASAGGIVLAREPIGAASIVKDISGSEVFRNYLPHADAGRFKAVYVVDQLVRLGSYRRVEGFPLVLVVAHGLDDVLVPWRRQVRLDLAISALMVLALAALGLRVAMQMRATERAERRFRLLADHAGDAILCFGLDGRRLYVSPAFAALTGWSVRDGLDRRWEDFLHPDDREAVARAAAGIAAGMLPEPCELRYRCRDGRIGWAEMRVQRLAAGAGAPVQIVANFREVTQRRLAEDRVAGLNRELAVQATTDGLTGLANRRRFDEALAVEWRRAAREEGCLSLLMVDVDRFKLFNDRYGHPEGDRCLRVVAEAIAGFGGRAGDIVARFGGEEFVCLLPGAEAAAAAVVAERMRAAIAACGLVHAENPPGGVVTASIGVSTCWPAPQDREQGPSRLVAAADAALYAAKAAGRNQVMARTTDPQMAAAG